jgi:hypothetical protein
MPRTPMPEPIIGSPAADLLQPRAGQVRGGHAWQLHAALWEMPA